MPTIFHFNRNCNCNLNCPYQWQVAIANTCAPSLPLPFKTRLPHSSNVTSNASNVASNQCQEMSRGATLRTEAHSKHVRHGANLDLPKIIANLSREKDFGTATLSIDRVTTYSLTLWVRNGWGWA